MKPVLLNLKTLKFFPVFLLINLNLNVFSQGEFLHKGQSGIQLDGFFMEAKKNIYIDDDQGVVSSKNATMTGYGGKFGFSVKGVFDLQWSINGWALPSTSLYPESKGSTVYVRAVIHVKKQSDKLPFSIRGIFAYGYSKFDEIPTTDTDIDFGLGISRRTYIRDNISIVPTIDFLYSLSSYTMNRASDFEESGGQVVVSLPIAFNLYRNHLLHFAPFINYGMSNSEGSYGLNLGYIIPFYVKPK